MNDARYYSLNTYLRQTFGEKVYRLSLNGGMTCPNRDGSIGTGGCIFCSAGGSGDFAASRSNLSPGRSRRRSFSSVKKQTAANISPIFRHTRTPTLPSVFFVRFIRKLCAQAETLWRSPSLPDVTVCHPMFYDLLAELNTIKPVWVELGLQTIHEHTLRFIRSGFSLAQYEQAVSALHARGIKVITHLILGLPGETTDDMRASVRYLAAHPRLRRKAAAASRLRGHRSWNTLQK